MHTLQFVTVEVKFTYQIKMSIFHEKSNKIIGAYFLVKDFGF